MGECVDDPEHERLGEIAGGEGVPNFWIRGERFESGEEQGATGRGRSEGGEVVGGEDLSDGDGRRTKALVHFEKSEVAGGGAGDVFGDVDEIVGGESRFRGGGGGSEGGGEDAGGEIVAMREECGLGGDGFEGARGDGAKRVGREGVRDVRAREFAGAGGDELGDMRVELGGIGECSGVVGGGAESGFVECGEEFSVGDLGEELILRGGLVGGVEEGTKNGVEQRTVADFLGEQRGGAGGDGGDSGVEQIFDGAGLAKEECVEVFAGGFEHGGERLLEQRLAGKECGLLCGLKEETGEEGVKAFAGDELGDDVGSPGSEIAFDVVEGGEEGFCERGVGELGLILEGGESGGAEQGFEDEACAGVVPIAFRGELVEQGFDERARAGIGDEEVGVGGAEFEQGVGGGEEDAGDGGITGEAIALDDVEGELCVAGAAAGELEMMERGSEEFGRDIVGLVVKAAECIEIVGVGGDGVGGDSFPDGLEAAEDQEICAGLAAEESEHGLEVRAVVGRRGREEKRKRIGGFAQGQDCVDAIAEFDEGPDRGNRDGDAEAERHEGRGAASISKSGRKRYRENRVKWRNGEP